MPPFYFETGCRCAKKLTNTVIAKLAVPAGKASVKLFDTDVGGLGVLKMASGVATFIFEMRPKGAIAMKQVKIGRCGDMSVDQARARARELALDYTSPDFLQTEAAHPYPPLTSVERSDLNDTKAINVETSKGLLFPTYKDSRAKAIRRALNKLQQNEYVQTDNTSLSLTERGLLFFRSIDHCRLCAQQA